MRGRNCCHVRAAEAWGQRRRRTQKTQKEYPWAKQAGLAKKVPPHLLRGASSIFPPEENLGIQAIQLGAGPEATAAIPG